MDIEIKDSLLASALAHNISALCVIQCDTCGISSVADAAVETIKQEIAKLCIELCAQYPDCYNGEFGEHILCVSNRGRTDAVNIIYDHNGCIHLSCADPISRSKLSIVLDAPAFKFDLKKTGVDERCSLAEIQERQHEIDHNVYRNINNIITMPRYLRDYILYIAHGMPEAPKLDTEERLTSQLTKLRKALNKLDDFRNIVSTDDARVLIITEHINSDGFRKQLAEFDKKLRGLDRIQERLRMDREIQETLRMSRNIAHEYEELIKKDIAAKCPVNYTGTAAFIADTLELIRDAGHTIDYFMSYYNNYPNDRRAQNPHYLIYNTCINSNLRELRRVLKSYHIAELIPKAEFTTQLITASQSPTKELAENIRRVAENDMLYDSVAYPVQECIINERFRDINKYTRDDVAFITDHLESYYSNIEPAVMDDSKKSVRFNLEEESTIYSLLLEYIIPEILYQKLPYARDPDINGIIQYIAEKREYISEKALNDVDTLTACADGMRKDIEFNISMLESIRDNLLRSDDQILLRYLADTKVIGKREFNARIAELAEE